MRTIFVQISGLIGIITFLNHLWSNASVERTVFVSLAVGLSIYFVLVTGDRVIQQILEKPVAGEPEDAKVKNETVATNPAMQSANANKPATTSKAGTAQA